LKRTYCIGKHRRLVDASKESGVEVNVDWTKYMVMSREQNAGEFTVQTLIIVPLKG